MPIITHINQVYLSTPNIIFINSTGWVPLEPLHPLRDGHRIIAENLVPILKEKLEGRVRGFVCYLLKFLVFGASVAAMWLAIRLFLPATVFEGGVLFWIALVAVTLFLYDILLTRLVSKYLLVWRKRFFKG